MLCSRALGQGVQEAKSDPHSYPLFLEMGEHKMGSSKRSSPHVDGVPPRRDKQEQQTTQSGHFQVRAACFSDAGRSELGMFGGGVID